MSNISMVLLGSAASITVFYHIISDVSKTLDKGALRNSCTRPGDHEDMQSAAETRDQVTMLCGCCIQSILYKHQKS
jgi:hypothetical protein